MALALTPGYAFATTEQVTSAKLALLVSAATGSGIDQTNFASGSGCVITSSSQPSNTNAIWIDSGNGNILKVYNGSSWVQIQGINGLSGLNYLRNVYISIAAGGTPGTNITCSHASDASNAFNAGVLTDAANLAKNASSGSFALSSDGKTLTITTAETVTGTLHYSFDRHIVKNASVGAGDIFFLHLAVSSGKIAITFRRTGSASDLDITAILTTAGDELALHLGYISSI